MRNRCLIIFILLSIFTIQLLNAQKARISNPLIYELNNYKDTTYIIGFYKRTLRKIIFDFNCDGLTDLALSDPYMGGAHNAPWNIYLQRKDHTYFFAGTIWCEDFLRVISIKRGAAKLITYEHYSGQEGFVNEDEISFNGIGSLKTTSTKFISRSYLNSLFINSHFSDSCCSVRNLLININSPWSGR